MRMVASNVWGLSFKARIRFEVTVSSFSRVLTCVGDKEKKAISLPEIKAEHTTKSISNTIEKIIPLEVRTKRGKIDNNKLPDGGSESKLIYFV